MRKIVLLGCVLGLLAYTVDVSAASSMSLITKERIEASKIVKDSKLKNWIDAHTKFMVREIDMIQGEDALADALSYSGYAQYVGEYYDYKDGETYKTELLSDLK
jgi:uncharacterized protein (DUF2147 family)